MKPETRVGYDYAHAIVDDHSRLAYVELHDDETARTVTGFVERALGFFSAHGIHAERLMTDNAFAYVKTTHRDREVDSWSTRRKASQTRPPGEAGGSQPIHTRRSAAEQTRWKGCSAAGRDALGGLCQASSKSKPAGWRPDTQSRG